MQEQREKLSKGSLLGRCKWYYIVNRVVIYVGYKEEYCQRREN